MSTIINRLEGHQDLKKEMADFLHLPEAAYGKTILTNSTADGINTVTMQVSSIDWKGSIWKHWIIMYIPTTLNYDRVFSILDGGKLTNGVPDVIPETHPIYAPALSAAKGFSLASGMITAFVRNIPNSPILGTSGEEEFEEFSLTKIFDTRDISWLYYRPMVKSCMQCFRAIREVVHELKGVDIKAYAPSGLSKRGLTTYFAGIYDDYAEALVPIVMDYLNTKHTYLKQFEIYGPASLTYPIGVKLEEMGALYGNEKPLGIRFREIFDPYGSLEALTKPTYSILGSKDPFFALDTAKDYVKDLPDISLAYQKNIGHDISPTHLIAGVYWYKRLLDGSRLPTLTWIHTETLTDITVTVTVSSSAYNTVNVNSATSTTENFLASSFSTSVKSVTGTTFSVTVNKNSTKMTGFYIEVLYNISTGMPTPFNVIPYTICTRAYILNKTNDYFSPTVGLTLDYFDSESIAIKTTIPSSLYPISHYEVYVNGSFYETTLDDSRTWKINGLSSLVSYVVKVRAVDTSNNKSAFSNEITQTTT